nr:type V CRISPR-associated protein Cas12k [Leptolyngbya sp. FACHB-17]
MAEKHTPLINELLKHIAQDSQFEEWSLTGRLSRLVVSEACNQLKQDPQFAGQPGRFYSSAISTVHRIFTSWLALQTRLRNQIAGQTRWLVMLQSDDELTIASQTDINTLRSKASELLAQLNESVLESDQPEVKKKTEVRKINKHRIKQEQIFLALFSSFMTRQKIA